MLIGCSTDPFHVPGGGGALVVVFQSDLQQISYVPKRHLLTTNKQMYNNYQMQIIFTLFNFHGMYSVLTLNSETAPGLNSL